jgi:tripartite ATP-independent transporter DctP family solute receptor
VKDVRRYLDYRRMTLYGVLAVVVFTLAACGGGGGGGGGEAEHSFRLAETHPKEHPTAQADQEFAQLVDEKSDGRIEIETFLNAQLGEEADVIEQVQTGSIEMTRVSTAPMAEFADSMEVFSLPYIFDDGDHMWRFLDGEGGQELLGQLEDSGFKGLVYYDGGARSFYTSEGAEVTSLEDIQGLQIRVQQSDINTQWMQALGARSTPLDYGEVYSSLQSGVIDGAENNWTSYLTANHYEVAPNYIENQHQRVPEVLMMSQQTWDQLSEEDQQIIQEAADESVEFQREAWQESEEEAQQQVAEEGSNIIEYEEIEDIDEWKEAVQPVIDDNRSDFGEVLDQIEAAR